MSFPEYLASWLSRYPSDRAWVDDDANFACRRSEAEWLSSLRMKRVVLPFENKWTLRSVDQALWAANGAREPAG